MTKQTALTSEQIACVYAWLAQLFLRELDNEKLIQIQSDEMADWFSMLQNQPSLSDAITGLTSKIAALKVRNDAQLELAADFCSLFLMSDKQSALPYASVYLKDEQTNEKIKRLLFEAGMETDEVFHEPTDHLSIFLELLSHLHFSLGEEDMIHEEIDELRKQTLSILLQWLPEFCKNCHQYDEFGFYSALSQLLVALVQLDEQDE